MADSVKAGEYYAVKCELYCGICGREFAPTNASLTRRFVEGGANLLALVWCITRCCL